MNEIIKAGNWSILIDNNENISFSKKCIINFLGIEEYEFNDILKDFKGVLDNFIEFENDEYITKEDTKIIFTHKKIPEDIRLNALKELKEAIKIINDLKKGSKWDIVQRQYEITGSMIKKINDMENLNVEKFTHYDLTLEDHKKEIEKKVDKEEFNKKIEKLDEIVHNAVAIADVAGYKANEINEKNKRKRAKHISDMEWLRKMICEEWLKDEYNVRYSESLTSKGDPKIKKLRSDFFSLLHKWSQNGTHWKGNKIPPSPLLTSDYAAEKYTNEQIEDQWKWYNKFSGNWINYYEERHNIEI